MSDIFEHKRIGAMEIFLTAFLAFGILVSSPRIVNAQSGENQPAAEPHASAPEAQSVPPKVESKISTKPYYIEFRARSAHNYGHTFSIYGRLNANGTIASKTVAGLHPATESPVPWMIGHFVLVPSETGASDGDTEDQYVTSRFRVVLSAEEYKKVVGYIKGLQSKSPVWHAVLYNCSAFIGDIAAFMGMEKPASTLLMPATYINSLRELNISKTTGLIGTPVKVQTAEQLRREALKAIGREKKGSTNTAAAKPVSTSDASSAKR